MTIDTLIFINPVEFYYDGCMDLKYIYLLAHIYFIYCTGK